MLCHMTYVTLCHLVMSHDCVSVSFEGALNLETDFTTQNFTFSDSIAFSFAMSPTFSENQKSTIHINFFWKTLLFSWLYDK